MDETVKVDCKEIFNDSVNYPDSDILRVTPLGAGQEVGRSCLIVEFKGKRIMLDCGLHPGYHGLLSLPFLDAIDPSEIDIIFITHFHLDHCGSLPYFLSRTHFKGRVFMTPATKAIYKWLLTDYIKVTGPISRENLFTEAQLEATLDRIETIHFHQEKEVCGIWFTCYHAGHVLGAAMFLINISGVKILYTGDFSRHEDRHLVSAEIPSIKPDLLIMESTYGIYIHEKREVRETRFTNAVRDIVLRGGRCLIPSFALGRAQEQLLILDEFWEKRQDELSNIPIFYASALAKKCMAVYQTYSSAMNQKMQNQIIVDNPFKFKHISFVKGMSEFTDSGPCAILASPGMLQNGFSRDLFERWCSDPKNGVIIAGYSCEGTLAKELMSEPEQIMSITGRTLKRKCSIDYVSFSAHADYIQFKELVEGLLPPHIMLVHGEANEMTRLRSSLLRDLESKGHGNIEIYMPKNCTSLNLHFKGETNAKIVGDLALNFDASTDHLSGVVIKSGFSYKIVAPEDLTKFTELKTTKIHQNLSVPFPDNEKLFQILINNLTLLTGSYMNISTTDTSSITIHGIIKLKYSNNTIDIEWESSIKNDMIADAVLAVILETSKQQHTIKEPNINEIVRDEKHNGLIHILKERYGDDKVICIEDGQSNHKEIHVITINDKKAIIDLSLKTVSCTIPMIQECIERILYHYFNAVQTFCNCNSNEKH